MTKFYTLLFSCTCIFLSSCVGELPFVGLDQDGNPLVTGITNREYKKHLTTALIDMNDSVIPAVSEFEQLEQKTLNLYKIRMGLALSGSVGLGSLYRLGGSVGFRLVFAQN